MNENTTITGTPPKPAAAKIEPKHIQVDPALIARSLTNPRGPDFTAAEDWPEFVASIRQHGVKQWPLVRELPAGRTDAAAKGRKYELVAGERRVTAALAAKLPAINVVLEALADAQVVEIQQIENLQRSDLSALEEAQGYAAWRDSLLKAGTVKTVQAAVEYIGEKINRKPTAVYGKLALLKTAPAVQAAVKEGKLDASKAALIAQIPDEKQQAEVLKEAIAPARGTEEPPSYRELKAIIQTNYRITLKNAPFSQDAVFASVKLDGKPAPKCADCPYRTGNIPAVEGDANICTNPACFQEKCAAVAGNKSPLIAAVWSVKTYQMNRYSNEYVDEDSTCYEAPGHKKWKDILGTKAPPAIYALAEGSRFNNGDSMNLKRIWKKAEVLKFAKDNGLIKPEPKRKASAAELAQRKREKAQQAKEEAQEAAEKKVMEDRLTEIVGGLAGNLLEKNRAVFWRNLALMALETFLENYDEEEIVAVMKGHGMGHQVDKDWKKNADAIRKTIQTTPLVDNLPGYVVELLLRNASTWTGYGKNKEQSEREKMMALWPAGKSSSKPVVAKVPSPAKAKTKAKK